MRRQKEDFHPQDWCHRCLLHGICLPLFSCRAAVWSWHMASIFLVCPESHLPQYQSTLYLTTQDQETKPAFSVPIKNTFRKKYVIQQISSSSCSGRIRFDSCSLYPQNEIGPSISSSVVLCVFVLLVYIVGQRSIWSQGLYRC